MPCLCWREFGSEGSRQRSFRIRPGAAAPACGGTSWRAMGFSSGADASVFCGDVGWRKPNPAPFQRALELIHVAPADAIFVGDDARWDVIGAQNAGLRPVILCPSHVPDIEGCVGINRLADVLDLL